MASEDLAAVPVSVLERVYRAIIALPHPLGDELAEATEELYRAVAEGRPRLDALRQEAGDQGARGMDGT